MLTFEAAKLFSSWGRKGKRIRPESRMGDQGKAAACSRCSSLNTYDEPQETGFFLNQPSQRAGVRIVLGLQTQHTLQTWNLFALFRTQCNSLGRKRLVFLDSLEVEFITVNSILHVWLINFSPGLPAIDFQCWKLRSNTKYHLLGLRTCTKRLLFLFNGQGSLH